MQHRRLAMFILFATALSGPALADARQDVQAGIARCASLADDHQFLDCVYGAAQPLRAQLGLPPAPANQTRLVPPPAGVRMVAPSYQPPVQTGAVRPVPSAPKTGFFSGLVGGGPHTVLRIATYTFDKRGMFTVTLSDGEILRQADNDVHYAHWHGAPKGVVTVLNDSLGGPTMTVEGENDPYLIVRVR